MKSIVFIFLACWGGLGAISAQNFDWVVQNETSLLCESRVLTYSMDGSLVNAGIFQGTMDLDPGPGMDMHTSQNNSVDVFVQKLDSNGNFLWGRTWQGTQNEDLQGLLLDASGNVYLAGAYESGWDADPGTGVSNLSGIGFEAFIVKLDPNGNFLWAMSSENKSFSGETRSAGLDMDAAGNLVAVGTFRHTVDFDPGSGVDTLQNTTISGANPIGTYPNCFLWRLDTSGNHLQVIHTVANASSAVVNQEVDMQGNILMSGTFAGTADFDPSPGISNLTATTNFSTNYLQKLDSAGNLLWVRQVATFIAEIETDPVGDLYLGGYFSNTVDFDPGSGLQNMTVINGTADGYLVKWDANGNYAWKGQFGGGASERVVDVEVAPNGNILVLGGFRDSIDLDPGPGLVQVAGPLNEKAFLVSMDGAGLYNWGWAIDPGNNNPIRPYAVAVNMAGDFAISGDFAGAFDFDPGPPSVVLNSPGGFDGFVAQWADTSTVVGISQDIHQATIYISPNPNQGTFNLTSSERLNDCRIAIVNLQGHILYEAYFDQLKTTPVDLGLTAGFYLIRVESRELNAHLRMQVY